MNYIYFNCDKIKKYKYDTDYTEYITHESDVIYNNEKYHYIQSNNVIVLDKKFDSTGIFLNDDDVESYIYFINSINKYTIKIDNKVINEQFKLIKLCQ